MAHIDFSIGYWTAHNPEGKLEDLVEAIKKAGDVYAGWTVEDAETVREDEYKDRSDLSIKDSQIVMEIAISMWEAGNGFNWDNLYQAYKEYLSELDTK